MAEATAIEAMTAVDGEAAVTEAAGTAADAVMTVVDVIAADATGIAIGIVNNTITKECCRQPAATFFIYNSIQDLF